MDSLGCQFFAHLNGPGNCTFGNPDFLPHNPDTKITPESKLRKCTNKYNSTSGFAQYFLHSFNKF